MKKYLRCAALAAVLCLICGAFCSCHGARELSEFEIPESFDTKKQYEITFWAKNDTNISQVKIYEKAIEDFEKLYPNIKVTLVKYTDYNVIYNDVITNIPTGTTPNVCVSYPDHIATYLTGENTVVPLDTLANDEKYGLGGSEIRYSSVAADEVVPKFLEECRINGTLYAIPFMRSTEACYINKTVVESLGYTVPDVLTWDFIWEVSEKAAEKNADGTYKANGQKVMMPFIYKSTDNMMIQMIEQKGSGYATSFGKIELFCDETKELMRTVWKHASTGAFNTFKLVSYPGNYFNAEQCIFAIDSTAGATWIGSDAPLMEISRDDVRSFETVVRTVPQFDTENQRMISQGPSLCLFNKEDSGEVLASWIFCQYLLTNDVQISYSQTEGYVPVTLRAQNSDEYKDYLSRSGEDNSTYYSVKIDAAKLLLEHIEDTFTTPVFNGSANLRDAAGYLIEYANALGQRGNELDDEAIETAFTNAVSLKHLNVDGNAMSEKGDLGPLPAGSKALLWTLATVWVIIGGAFAANRIKKKKNR